MEFPSNVDCSNSNLHVSTSMIIYLHIYISKVVIIFTMFERRQKFRITCIHAYAPLFSGLVFISNVVCLICILQYFCQKPIDTCIFAF